MWRNCKDAVLSAVAEDEATLRCKLNFFRGLGYVPAGVWWDGTRRAWFAVFAHRAENRAENRKENE